MNPGGTSMDELDRSFAVGAGTSSSLSAATVIGLGVFKVNSEELAGAFAGDAASSENCDEVPLRRSTFCNGCFVGANHA